MGGNILYMVEAESAINSTCNDHTKNSVFVFSYHEFFRAGDVSWNKGTLINSSLTTHVRTAVQEKILWQMLSKQHFT